MRNTKGPAIAFGLALYATAAPGVAQESKGFVQDGQVILSAERMFGFAYTSTKNEAGSGTGTTTDSGTSISLLWPSGPTPYQVPRVAFDVDVASGFTVGGSIGFATASGTTKSATTNGPTTESDSPSTMLFTFAPRVGFALPLTDQFAFWPRAGITYYTAKADLTSPSPIPGTPAVTAKSTISGLGLDIEPMFVFSPLSHFGITIGPVFDIPLSGSRSIEITPSAGPQPPDDKYKYMSFGLTVGMLGYF